MFTRSTFRAATAAALVAAACADRSTDITARPASAGEAKVLTNGGFEGGTNGQPPPAWTVTPYLNPGVTIETPQTRAGLNLMDHITGVADPFPYTYTLVTTAGPGSQTDANLGPSASFRWPAVGNAVAVVNRQGSNRNANSMKQRHTVSPGDIDPLDGLYHLRLLLAPVLQDPGHDPSEQPYVYVQATKVFPDEQVLARDFEYANQPGRPWKQVTIGGTNVIQYTDWLLIDFPLRSAAAAPGDIVELEIIAAGCSRGAHWGQAYVDEVSPRVSRPIVTATGPGQANENTNITYALQYENWGSTTASGVQVEFNTPTNTTFSSLSAGDLTCTVPPAGAAGLVTCTVGTLPPGGGGRLWVTVHIDNGTGGNTVNAANYSLKATGLAPVLGPQVSTAVTRGVTYADLQVAATDGVTLVAAGAPLTYTITVSNAGPNSVNGASVSVPLPSLLQDASWTCLASGGATCTASGTGAIADLTTLPAGGTLVYTLSATVDRAATVQQLALLASAAVPAGAVDPFPDDDTAVDYDLVTAMNGTACRSGADCTSLVCSTTDHQCGLPLREGPCAAATAATVCRSGACSQDRTCTVAGGCNVDADCPAGWCSVDTATCAGKLASGTAMPTDASHRDPALDGTCTAEAAALVCASGVCSPADARCGLPDREGPCTEATAATVCRSGACSQDGTCRAPSACNVDADCPAGWCDVAAATCTGKLASGAAMPIDASHRSPTLDGTCTAEAAALVCAAGVCSPADARCGLPDREGPCTDATAATVCRSGACSQDGTCRAASACNVDGDCPAGWCNVSAATCTGKLASGAAMPIDASHRSPALDGTCTPEAATLVCAAGVCSPADARCGLPDREGPCTDSTAATVCRSGACSQDGTCRAASACNVDADCPTGWCDVSAATCTGKLASGAAMPIDASHRSPALDGTCTTEAGALVCAAGVCSPADARCGLSDREGPCTDADAATVCRSGECSEDGTCRAASACNVDGDCPAGWCDVAAAACAGKLANGTAMPADAAHHDPVLDGTCTAEAGALVCASGVCDPADRACGLRDGDGPCTEAAAVCRSGLCAASGPHAGTCVACVAGGACAGATPVCDTATATCAACTGDAGDAAAADPCPAATPYCHLDGSAKGECGACTADADCAGRAGRTACDRTTGACVEKPVAGGGGGGGGCSSGPAGAASLMLSLLGLAALPRRRRGRPC